MRTRHSLLRICYPLISSILLAAIGVVSVLAATWTSAGAITSVSADNDVRNRDRVSLTTAGEQPLIAWASGVVSGGIYWAEQTAGGWDRTRIATPLHAWAPSIATGNGQSLLVWMQGVNQTDSSIARSVVVQEIGGARQTIAEDVYGRGLPHLVSGSDRFHLVYSVATSKDGTSVLSDLYYTSRGFGASSWITPTAIVTNGTVISSNALNGSVENAAIAVDGNTVYVAWEQRQVLPLTSPPFSEVDYSIWYMMGELAQPGQPVWSDPQRVSPLNQRAAVLPNVMAASGGAVHVTWTELIGPSNDPDEQHIFHRSLDQTTATRLNAEDRPVMVNGRFPSRATTALAVQEHVICVAWHGYDRVSATSMENITLRCSYDDGIAWGLPIDASESDDRLSIFPSIGFDSHGLLHVAWAEYELRTSGYVPYGVFHRSGDISESHHVFLPLVLRGR